MLQRARARERERDRMAKSSRTAATSAIGIVLLIWVVCARLIKSRLVLVFWVVCVRLIKSRINHSLSWFRVARSRFFSSLPFFLPFVAFLDVRLAAGTAPGVSRLVFAFAVPQGQRQA
jgi:hypothetical protein